MSYYKNLFYQRSSTQPKGITVEAEEKARMS